MARKWQKMGDIGRERIGSSKTSKKMAGKGHFVIYTTDKKRFVIPLAYLSNTIFLELLKMSEEEFGLQANGPLTLPCDSLVMNYILSLMKRGLAKDLEKAVLNTVSSCRCSSNITFHLGQQSLSL
ncbi:Auxin responsive SAUR protein [Corchorus olitorius]|uniref:Auxin responsive SAUR protein n=1 Tax=Corchorus olitorius TaxID=93759 RepID=A0A1R3JAW7_9ROSI|nr:Auxin responsive SAUR protein [Corchorus olitorius]